MNKFIISELKKNVLQNLFLRRTYRYLNKGFQSQLFPRQSEIYILLTFFLFLFDISKEDSDSGNLYRITYECRGKRGTIKLE